MHRLKPGDSLTFVSGYMAERPLATTVLQGAINAALEGLVRGLALEFAPVRVNTVLPGVIETPPWSRMPEADSKTLFASASERLPARRIGQPEDMANAILFLAITPFATGSVVRVHGGGVIG